MKIQVDFLKERAKELRRNMTDAEKILWKHLRSRSLSGFKFKRQEVIGNYIVDFVCHREKLIIELDGSQHIEEEAHDKLRTEWLKSRGYRVLRFWNNEVLQELDGVLIEVAKALGVEDL